MPAPVHVLIVEDEPLTREGVALVLSMSGYRVTTATNGVQGVEAYRNDPADILVTDLEMPRLDGAGLIAQLRALRPDLPAVVVTGESAPDLRTIGSAGVRTTVLTKPARPSLLLAALRASLPERPPAYFDPSESPQAVLVSDA